MTFLVPLLGLDGKLSLTQQTNLAGWRSRGGEKGSSAYNGCKAAKFGHLTSSIASSQDQGCWPQCQGKTEACCPLPSSSPWGLRLGVTESAEGQTPGPGQIPKRKAKWEAGGPGKHGRGQRPKAGEGLGMGLRGPVMWPRRWLHCAPWPSCGGPQCSRSCGPAHH